MFTVFFFNRKQSFSVRQNQVSINLEDEGIYQTIPFDMPMFEVQTVAIEMGPEESVPGSGRGISNETYCSYTSQDHSEDHSESQHYQDLNEEEEEHVYDYLPNSVQSGYEVQTLTVDVKEAEVVPGAVSSESVEGEVSYETGFYDNVTTEIRRKPGIYELPRYEHLLMDEDDEEDEDEGEDEDYEDIYDNVFFPEAPTDEVKRRTLRIEPEETAEEGIFSYENKVSIKL